MNDQTSYDLPTTTARISRLTNASRFHVEVGLDLHAAVVAWLEDAEALDVERRAIVEAITTQLGIGGTLGSIGEIRLADGIGSGLLDAAGCDQRTAVALAIAQRLCDFTESNPPEGRAAEPAELRTSVESFTTRHAWEAEVA